MARSFERLRVVAPAEAEESLVAALWAEGTMGLEIRPGDGPAAERASITVDAWFESGKLTTTAVDGFRAWGLEVARATIEEADYLARYRAAAEPFTVGDRFRVDPRDPVDLRDEGLATDPAGQPGDERVTLRIPARVAFGTGSHETTRLMLTMLEGIDLTGRDALDVGTGSGILSFAALRLGARRAVGFDLDGPSALVAGQNIALNPCRAAPTFFAGRLDALARSARFDLVLVNVLPERIGPDLPRIAGCVADGGMVLTAGALVADRQRAVSAWRSVGLAPRSERTDGEWIGLVLAPVEPGPGA